MSSVDDYYKGMDAYQILEVPRSADKKGVKAAYRKGNDHRWICDRTEVCIVQSNR